MNILRSLATATSTTPADDAKLDPTKVGVPTLDSTTALHNGLNIVYFLAGVICVIVIIIAAIMYATGGGNNASITKAKGLLLYSIIGLIVIGVAFLITGFVINSFS